MAKVPARYIPEGSREVRSSDGSAVVYVYANRCAMAYRGRRRHCDWHYHFLTDKELQDKIDAYFASIAAHQRAVAEQKALRARPHTIQIGDVVENSWGYDQTNVDFYQVVAVTKHTVDLRKIAAKTERTISDMSEMVVPIKDAFLNGAKVERRRVHGDNYVSFPYGAGMKWDGKPYYSSSYA